MSELGLCSRREADEWIARGWVSVNGAVISELGTKVAPNLAAHAITISRAARGEQAGRVTVLLHKPLGYVSGQAEDGYQPAVVLVTPPNRWKGDQSAVQFQREQLRSLVPAGRLDIDSTGLLILTQDGRIAKQLIGEDSQIEKEYLVRVAAGGRSAGARVQEALSPAKLALLNHGLHMDGKPLKPAKVGWAYPQQPDDDHLRFVLREGKKRQIRRMVEAVGLRVVALKRVRIGRVTLGNLPPGTWRYLREDEGF
jgi:23S rRNA pseudouridine2604 synthase